MMTTGVIDVRMELAATPKAAGAARDAMDEFAGGLREETLEDLRLVVSELVTNALLHARLGRGARIELRARLHDGSVRVEVLDPGLGFAPPDPPAPRGDSGWGLYLVDHLAARWGAERGRRNMVWLEIDDG